VLRASITTEAAMTWACRLDSWPASGVFMVPGKLTGAGAGQQGVVETVGVGRASLLRRNDGGPPEGEPRCHVPGAVVRCPIWIYRLQSCLPLPCSRQ
jgi:hypothetical protein